MEAATGEEPVEAAVSKPQGALTQQALPALTAPEAQAGSSAPQSVLFNTAALRQA